MKYLFSSLIFLFIIVSTSFAADKDWISSMEEAVEKAKTEKKLILVNFTGSDWCPPCIAIHEAVFSKKEFIEQVKKQFILCVIDSPKKDNELAEKNKPLLNKYKITGFPTLLLLDEVGTEFSRFNPSPFETVKKMKEQLNYQIRRKDMF